MTKGAILYARVSTRGQAEEGFSLRQQIEALRDWAGAQGYEILEEVEDPGQSGASLERPGLDRVRDLVAAGGVSVVLAQDRDRFAREPAYLYLLRREFEQHGTKIRSLADRGDESPEGELTDAILDQLAKFERAKIAERTRRGLNKKVKEGKLIRGPRPPYGFAYDGQGESLEVSEPEMGVLRRIFDALAVGGESLGEIARRLNSEAVPSPAGGTWHRPTLRYLALNELYRPYSVEELEATSLVSADVLAGLDPEQTYGIWTWQKRIQEKRRERGDDGEYRDRYRVVARGREHWSGVPIPLSDAGLSRALVDAARERLSNNHRRPASTIAGRFWQLSGGIARCGGCGNALSPHATSHTRADGSPSKRYFSYRCRTRYNNSAKDCDSVTSYPATHLEEIVWRAVYAIVTNPERLVRQWNKHLERQRRRMPGDARREAKGLTERLRKLEHRRGRYFDLAADGDMSREDLRAKLAEADRERDGLKKALREAQERHHSIEELERQAVGGARLVRSMGHIPYVTISMEDRRRLYQALRLRADAGPDGTIRLSGIFSPDVHLLNVIQDPPIDPGVPCPKVPEGSRVIVSLDNPSTTALSQGLWETTTIRSTCWS
jgi:site-specific DNA recombinase